LIFFLGAVVFLNKKETVGEGTQKKFSCISNRFIIISLICSFPYQFESCPKNVPLDYAILHQEENDSNSYKRQGVRRNEFYHTPWAVPSLGLRNRKESFENKI
jgi:hypothetical protein